MSNIDVHATADNCQACGEEVLTTDLTRVKLAGGGAWTLKLCVSCAARDTEEDYSSVVEDLKALRK